MLYNHRKQTESGGGESEKVRGGGRKRWLNADQGATRSSRVDQHTVLLNFFQEAKSCFIFLALFLIAFL